jgi:hypothetical protein
MLSLDDQLARIERFNKHHEDYRWSGDMYWAPTPGEWQQITRERIRDPGNLPSSSPNYLSVMETWATIAKDHENAVWDPRTNKWVLSDSLPGGLPQWVDQLRNELEAVDRIPNLTPAERASARRTILDRYLGAQAS